MTLYPTWKLAWSDCQSKTRSKKSVFGLQAQIGRPFPEIMKELGLEKQHLEIYETYKTYSRMCLDSIPLYDGVYETLEELKSQGNKIAMCTSKARDTVSLLEHKLPTFDYICCPTNGLRGKPNRPITTCHVCM